MKVNIKTKPTIKIEFVNKGMGGSGGVVDAYTKEQSNELFVAKELGKGLSTNDYTTEEKDKLATLNNYDDTLIKEDIAKKQDTLVSGTNIKTINGEPILGEGNLELAVDAYTKQESNDLFVAKEVGKGLSTNDFTTLEKDKLALLENYDDTQIKLDIEKKVDKVDGKGLSTNDYTTLEKEKLAGLENYDDTQIRGELSNKANKADIPTKTSQLNNDSNFLTQHQDISGKADKTELEKKQDTLVSGENIKTINGKNILGSGDIIISGGEIDLENYVKYDNGKIPIERAIQTVDVGKFTRCSQQYFSMWYEHTTQTIYCCVAGNTATGGVIKIRNNKIIDFIVADFYGTKSNNLVKIGNHIFVVCGGNALYNSITKITDEPFKTFLSVKHEGITTLGKCSLFIIEDRLLLFGADKKLYEVNQEELTLSAPILENLQYICQMSRKYLAIADQTQIYLWDGTQQVSNPKKLPVGYEKIEQIETEEIASPKGTTSVLIRNGIKVTTIDLTAPYGGGEVLMKELGEVSLNILSTKRIYNVVVSHDNHSFRKKGGAFYNCFSGGGRLEPSMTYVTVDRLVLNEGAWNWDSTTKPIYPTYKGFLM